MKISTKLKILAVVGLATGATAFAFSQQYTISGMCTASAPTINGYIISASAAGNLWDNVPTVDGPWYFNVGLYVDGVLVWKNGNKFGVPLPNSGWPGLTFDYVPTYQVTAGTHTVKWVGSTTEQIGDPLFPGNFTYTVMLTAPG